MGFENRKLEDNEIREYVLYYPKRGKRMAYIGCTIDTENDIRLYCYANGSLMEPSDIFSFIFDYKGEVFYIDLRQSLLGNDVYWYKSSDISYLSNEQLQSLREAMKVYAYEGFKLGEFMRANSDPTYVKRLTIKSQVEK